MRARLALARLTATTSPSPGSPDLLPDLFLEPGPASLLEEMRRRVLHDDSTQAMDGYFGVDHCRPKVAKASTKRRRRRARNLRHRTD